LHQFINQKPEKMRKLVALFFIGMIVLSACKKPDLPELTTTTPTEVTGTSVKTGGNITSDGGADITSRGVCWGITPNPTTANSKVESGSGSGSFTATITGLSSATKYYVRAYATNEKGTAYGNEVSFSTTLNPKQIQYGLIINYTATWCGPCGSWGAPRVNDMVALGNVVAVTNHSSGDPMYNATLYSQMTADRITGGGIPSFWVGNTKSSQVSTMSQLLNQTPVAGIDMKTKRTGDEISIDAMVKFFEAATGDIFLSFWMLESGIPATGQYNQSGNTDPNYKHKFVIRKSEGPVYGTQILSSPAAGAVHNKSLTMTVSSNWVNEVYIVAVLWRYDASGNPSAENPRYKYLNSFMYKE